MKKFTMTLAALASLVTVPALAAPKPLYCHLTRDSGVAVGYVFMPFGNGDVQVSLCP